VQTLGRAGKMQILCDREKVTKLPDLHLPALYYGTAQVKLSASSMLPLPLYLATCG
jgi:hypothetical protein